MPTCTRGVGARASWRGAPAARQGACGREPIQRAVRPPAGTAGRGQSVQCIAGGAAAAARAACRGQCPRRAAEDAEMWGEGTCRPCSPPPSSRRPCVGSRPRRRMRPANPINPAPRRRPMAEAGEAYGPRFKPPPSATGRRPPPLRRGAAAHGPARPVHGSPQERAVRGGALCHNRCLTPSACR